jgi:phosphatidylinositol alpha-1,6-mannosyltransferase
MSGVAGRLLLLSPSSGFGGGIERVAAAVQRAWTGEVTRLDLYRRQPHDRASGNLPAKIRLVASALKSAAKGRPDAVICLHMALAPVAIAAAAVVRSQATLIVHGREAWSPMPKWRRTLLSRRCRLLAVSSFTADWLAQRAGLDRTLVRVIHNPVGERFVREARKTLDRDRDAERDPACLLTVARITRATRYKGLFAVALALPDVLARHPGATWRIVGDGDDLPSLRRHCTELGIAGAVDFLGPLGDDALMEAYRTAGVFVLPSTADPLATPPTGEGFGLVYAEAACFGLPSIASSAGGGSLEFVRHGETGLTVAPGDRRALVDAMVELLGKPELRRQLGTAACSLVLQRHTPEQFARRLHETLTPPQ